MLISVFMVSLVALCVKMISSLNVAEIIYYRGLVGLTFSYFFLKRQNICIYITNYKEMFLVFFNSIVIFFG